MDYNDFRKIHTSFLPSLNMSQTIPLQSNTSVTLAHADANNLFLATYSGNILHYVFDTNTFTYSKTFEYSNAATTMENTPYNPFDGFGVVQMNSNTEFLFTLQHGTIYKWRIADGTFLKNVTLDMPKCLCFALYNDVLFTSHSNKFVFSISINTNRLVSAEYFDDGPLSWIAFFRSSFIYSTPSEIKERSLQNNLTTIIQPHSQYPPLKCSIDGDTLYAHFESKLVIFSLFKHFTRIIPLQSSVDLFAIYDGYIFIPLKKDSPMFNTLHVHDRLGELLKSIPLDNLDIKCIYANANKLFILVDSFLIIYPIHIAEEDTNLHEPVTILPNSILEPRNVNHCVNPQLTSLQQFTDSDNPIMIYTQNSNGQFSKAACFNHSELLQFYQSDRNSIPSSSTILTTPPTSLMAIYTRPSEPSTSGHGSKPTGKIVVKLPVNNLYITFGSAQRMLHSIDTNRTWYAVPLFGGKKRRLGNIIGMFGQSMNHGQLPGYLVYKLFTYNEVIDNIAHGKECNNDWPTFIHVALRPIFKIVQVDVFYAEALFSELLQTSRL